MAKAKIFEGGMPYGPDLDRLSQQFPMESLAEGVVITHQQLEEVLGKDLKPSRYYGVVNRWRAQHRKSSGIFMAWEYSVGLKVLKPPEVLNYSEVITRQKIRQTARATTYAKYVDKPRLNSQDQQRLDNYLSSMGKLRSALHVAARQMTVKLLPIESLPKRQLYLEG